MEIKKIVITGGPCAGKSAGFKRIKEEFEAEGYTVLFVAETATELILGGVAPDTCFSVAEYEKIQLILQTEKERVFLKAAEGMRKDKILIVCDRGTLDVKAYMSEDEFNGVLSCIGKSEEELRDDYDAVFHLVTAAKGAPEYYTTENNAARTETPEQAAELDDRLIDVWKEHAFYRIIDNSTDFNTKIDRLILSIKEFLQI